MAPPACTDQECGGLDSQRGAQYHQHVRRFVSGFEVHLGLWTGPRFTRSTKQCAPTREAKGWTTSEVPMTSSRSAAGRSASAACQTTRRLLNSELQAKHCSIAFREENSEKYMIQALGNKWFKLLLFCCPDLPEALRQRLAEEHDVGLHQAAAHGAPAHVSWRDLAGRVGHILWIMSAAAREAAFLGPSHRWPDEGAFKPSSFLSKHGRTTQERCICRLPKTVSDTADDAKQRRKAHRHGSPEPSMTAARTWDTGCSSWHMMHWAPAQAPNDWLLCNVMFVRHEPGTDGLGGERL